MAKISKIIGTGFAVFWMVFIFLEYWEYHSQTRKAIALFQFTELAIVLLALGITFTIGLPRLLQKKNIPLLQNGLGIFLLLCILALLCMNAFFYKNLGTFLSFNESITFLFTLLGCAAATYLIILLSYATGRMLIQIFRMNIPLNILPLLSIGLGILLLVGLLFILGVMGLLHSFILWPLVVLLLILSWRSAWHFIKISLWVPIPAVANLNGLGLGAFYVLILLLSMNFVQVLRPFPTGFDAMTYYVNISSLVNDYKSLIPGFGAYNWSLFITLGYLLFNENSITLALSFSGSILSLFALFQLSRKWLDPNYSLLVLFLFYSLPIIGWLSYRDMKVDMGLLFFSLLILLLFIDWINQQQKSSKKEQIKKGKLGSREIKQLANFIENLQPTFVHKHRRIILIGILTGFALGIKLSALIILLALLPALAYTLGGVKAFRISLIFILFGVLIARLDSRANLRALHQWADQLQWVLLMIGLALSIHFFLKSRDTFVAILRSSVIYVSFATLTLSPWLIKNAIETQDLSLTSLTQGKDASPKPNIQDIQRAYEKQINGQ